MKKILMLFLCVATLLVAGCDKFAKEKDAITKAEKIAMATELPPLVKPDFTKQPRPSRQEIENAWKKYREDLDKFVEAEEKILDEMRKSDVRIAEMEKKAENDSEKKNLQEFKEKVLKERIEFVKKVSKGRLYGDTFIVGVGSTWQEVEMVFGKPPNEQIKNSAFKEYKYDGIKFEDHIGGGVPPKEILMKWVSKSVQCVFLTGSDITSDTGIKIGMTDDEVFKTLKSKYVNKGIDLKDEMFVGQGFAGRKDYTELIVGYSTKETLPYNMFVSFKDGKLTKYVVAPH